MATRSRLGPRPSANVAAPVGRMLPRSQGAQVVRRLVVLLAENQRLESRGDWKAADDHLSGASDRSVVLQLGDYTYGGDVVTQQTPTSSEQLAKPTPPLPGIRHG